MIDSDRVITLDDLVESVPEVLVREAEEKMNTAQSAVEEVNYSIKDPLSMSKELSKAQRIRLYMENNPEARNRDVVEALSIQRDSSRCSQRKEHRKTTRWIGRLGAERSSSCSPQAARRRDKHIDLQPWV